MADVAPQGPSRPADILSTIQHERKALETLRDEVNAKLESLSKFSDLQEENSSLREACETLGRELVGVKHDIATLKAHILSKASGTPATGLATDPLLHSWHGAQASTSSTSFPDNNIGMPFNTMNNEGGHSRESLSAEIVLVGGPQWVDVAGHRGVLPS